MVNRFYKKKKLEVKGYAVLHWLEFYVLSHSAKYNGTVKH